MVNESRTAKSIHNIKIALLFYFFNIILQFFSRKIFLDYLGSEVLGLNTTAQNLLGFLNIAELGIGNAIAYNLYKPLYDKNHKDINEIVSIQGWLYRRVAYIVIIGSCLLMCLFPLIFAKAQIPLWYAYGSFLTLLASSLLSYFINYQQIVLSADQKDYKITANVQGVKIIKLLLQILAIRFLDNGYVWWMILEVVMACVTSYTLNKSIQKEYPWLHPQISKGKYLQKLHPRIISDTKKVFFHKIAGFVLGQTSPLIIYAYASLTLVAIYGNYMLIITGITSLLTALLNNLTAGVGNLIATGDKNRIKNVFWEITASRIWIAATICFALYTLGDKFITIWVGSQYILPHTPFIILISITFISLSRTNDAFIAGYGLFQDIWAPIAESILNLGLSILFGYYWGLTGILCGVLCSLLLIVYIWKPYFLYRKGFKESIMEYVLHYAKYLSVLLISFFISDIIISQSSYTIDSYAQWFIYAIIVTLLYAIISFTLLFLTDKAPRRLLKRLYNFNNTSK